MNNHDESRHTFSIPDWNMHRLLDRINTLNRRAEKLGCEPVVLERLGERVVDHVEKDAYGRVTAAYKIKVQEVRLEGKAPALNGWRFVATVDHSRDAGNMLYIVPGEEVPNAFRHCPPNCDHCKSQRFRKDTYVVRNEASGEYLQVGKQCLKDFLGHRDPALIAGYLSGIQKMMDELDSAEDYAYGGDPIPYFDLDGYLAEVVKVMDKDGWVSSAQADDFYQRCTADIAWEVFRESFKKPARLTAGHQEIHQDALGRARDAIAWAGSLRDTEEKRLSNYEHSLSVLAGSGVVDAKGRRLAASLVPAHQRALSQERRKDREREQRQTSGHFGTPGKRETFQLTCVHTQVIPGGQFGDKVLHTFEDGQGNAAVWFSSGRALKIGKTYEIKATVKEHGEYNGIKQTVLSRCKEAEVENTLGMG